MEQKLEEVKKQDHQHVNDYFEFIKESVKDKSYFKDGLNWYFFRYVSPICDRAMLFFGGIISVVVCYFLFQMIQSAFPLIVSEPLFLKAHNQSLYYPKLVRLKPNHNMPNYDANIKTVDEAVLKYLLIIYVQDRENYDFSKAEIEDVNKKFNRIKNNSSIEEYKNYQLIMSKDNPNSPINNFGLNVVKKVVIESFRFIREEPKDFTIMAREYLANKIPTKAELRFLATTKSTSTYGEVQEEKERYLARVDFKFYGIEKDSKDSNSLKFSVNSYKLFKVK
jgi:type IV secretory pathway component VirB8